MPRPLFVQRDVFYWSKNHGKQLKKGDDYGLLRPTISIAWLGTPRESRAPIIDSPRVHTRYRILETSTYRELTDHLEMHFLDMRNLATDATLTPALRRWAEFFDRPTEETLKRLSDEDPIMADTVNKLASVSNDDATRRIAEARWKGELAQWQDMKDAESRGHEEGKAEGIREGKAEGIRSALQAVLEVRFGGLDDAILERIAAMPDATLLATLERATQVRALDDLFEASTRE